jgi:hypothetical protein
MKELIQKSLWSREVYTIEEDRVSVKKTNFNKSSEYSVRFEEIGFDLFWERTKPVLWVIPIHVGFFILELYVLIDEYNKGVRFPKLLFWIFGALLFGTMAVYSFFQRRENVYLTGGSSGLKLNAINPNATLVKEFIDALHKAMRGYYKTTYGVIDPDLSKDESVRTFKWLKEIKAINQTEYKQLLEELNLRNLL